MIAVHPLASGRGGAVIFAALLLIPATAHGAPPRADLLVGSVSLPPPVVTAGKAFDAVKTTDYDYDPAGRLAAVRVDGAASEAYGYDDDGNRTSRRPAGANTETATCDASPRHAGLAA